MSWTNSLELARRALRVREETGKPILSQLTDVLRLRFSRTAIGPSEYFDYHLYRDELASSNIREYVGWRASFELDRALNLDTWRACANDKLLCYTLLRGLGLPYPETCAVYSRTKRRFLDSRSLTDLDSVGDFLRGGAQFPLFVKPIVGTLGRGAIALSRYDAAEDCVELSHGERVRVDDLLRGFDFEPFKGQLFQPVLKPHAQIRELCGDRICSVRISVVLRSQGPSILYTVWKIATGRNVTDNLAGGKVGNLTGWVDPGTGVVERVARGMGDDYTEVANHPDTGKPLLGLQLPEWKRIVALCLSAASALPGLRLQNWDVALCETGPVILEVNTETDFGPDQLYGRRGFLSPLLTAQRESHY